MSVTRVDSLWAGPGSDDEREISVAGKRQPPRSSDCNEMIGFA
jgi:hypothetical protein